MKSLSCNLQPRFPAIALLEFVDRISEMNIGRFYWIMAAEELSAVINGVKEIKWSKKATQDILKFHFRIELWDMVWSLAIEY